MKEKILIVGDSLSLPGHLNKYEDTWIYLLKEKFPNYDYITYLRRALTSEVLVTMGGGDKIDNYPRGADLLEIYMPQVVIIQLGIVDCGPRLFDRNKFSTKLINKMPLKIKDKIYKLKEKYIGRLPQNAFVNEEKFRGNFIDYLNRAQKNKVQKLIILGIGYPDRRIIHKSKYIIQSINKYNKILYELSLDYSIVMFVTPFTEDVACEEIYQDGYHPNKKGHKIIFEAISRYFK